MPLDLMVVIGGAGLAGLAFTARRLAGSWFFPPALFAGAWAGFILASLAVQFGYLTLTPSAILVFVVGAVVFVVAGTVAWAWAGSGEAAQEIAPVRGRVIRWVVLTYSAMLVVFAPIFLHTIRDLLLEMNLEELAVGARTVFSGEQANLVPHYFQSVSSVGTILTLLMAWLYDGSWRDRMLLGFSLASTLAMLVLTFSRTPLFFLVIGAGGLLLFRGRITRATAGLGVCLLVAGGVIMGSLLGKGPDYVGHASRFEAVAQNLGIYFVGGPIGFGEVMDHPTGVGESGLSLRFFTQALQSLGYPITLPNNVLDVYRAELGNVYTFYFAYWLDWGWAGVLFIAAVAGVFSTLLYCWSRRGNPIAGVGFGITLPALINSATGDSLFGSSVPWILTALVVGVLWKAPWPRSTS